MRRSYIYTIASLHIARLRRMYLFAATALIVLLIGFWAVFANAPRDFPRGEVINIPAGVSAETIGRILAEEDVVDSAPLFELVARTFFDSKDLQAGDYIFEKKLSTFSIAKRLIDGTYGLTPVQVTFFEGMTVREMAERLHETLPHISAARFRAHAADLEGYLFPDTYSILPNATAADVVDMMRTEFENQIAPLEDDIAATGRSLHDIVTMASLIERESRTPETRRMVSGILWNRIEIGMALQVDAVFGYIYDTETFSPRFSDLEVDSPYNTYQNVGLPPGPIANPGFDSILAAINPTENEYLFYLTGRDGNFYYARTFDQHLSNRRLYLD